MFADNSSKTDERTIQHAIHKEDSDLSSGCSDMQIGAKSSNIGILNSTGGGSSTASSRDTSPCRDLSPLVTNIKPPIVIRRGPHGLGFTVHTIRVYYGDTDFYTMHHLVMAVDEKSCAFAAGLRPADLITHINGEAVQGLFHTQVLQLLLNNSNSDHVTLRATPLEHTSIQTGGRKRDALQSKLAKKSVSRHKKHKKDAEKRRKSSLFRRISTKRASAEIQQMAVVISSPVGNIPNPLSRINISDNPISLQSSPLPSPSSSAPNTPTGHVNCGFSVSAANTPNHNKNISSQIYHHHHHHHHQRPSTLHGLKHKLHTSGATNKTLTSSTGTGQVLTSSSNSSTRRKSVGHIPLSPLARTPSPSPLSSSPTRSPSPLAFPVSGYQPGASNTTQSYSPSCALPTSNSICTNTSSISTNMSGCLTTSGTSIKKNNFTRPKSGEPGSPLLRRALSPDRLHPRSAESKISPLCCNSQIPSISVVSSSSSNINSNMSMGIKKHRHCTVGTSGIINIRRNDSTGMPGSHAESTIVNMDVNSTVNKLKEITEQKSNTSPLNSAMLSLSLQSSSELLPIAEERDSPTSASTTTLPCSTASAIGSTSAKKTDENGDKK